VLSPLVRLTTVLSLVNQKKYAHYTCMIHSPNWLISKIKIIPFSDLTKKKNL